MLFSMFSKQFAITTHISTTYTFHLSFRNLSKNSALSLPSFPYYLHYPYSFIPCFLVSHAFRAFRVLRTDFHPVFTNIFLYFSR